MSKYKTNSINTSLRTLLFFNKVKHAYILACLIALSSAFTTVAQQPTFSFQSQLSDDTILIGDQIEMTITARVPQGFEVQFPIFADTLVNGVEILGRPVIDSLTRRSGERELTYRLRLTSFDEDNYRIPRLKLPFTDGQTIDTALTSPIWLIVKSLPPDSTVTAIYDIKMPLAEPYTFAEIAPWVGGGLLLAGLIALIIFYLIKRKKNEPLFFPRKPADPPHVVALRQLEKIKHGKLWNTDNHKHYHTLLTDVIRYYIEGRFGVPAMEQTTFETINCFRKQQLTSAELIHKLDDTLSLADLVKFARFTPNVSENEAGLEFGFRFVNETKVEMVSDESEENINTDNPTQTKETESKVEPKALAVESSKPDEP